MARITTKSGYTVEFKDELDTAGYRAIQKANMKGTTMYPGMPESELRFSADVVFDAEEVALQHMIISVTTPEGVLAENPVEAVATMPFLDGDEVYTKVNELTTPVETEDVIKNAPAASSTT